MVNSTHFPRRLNLTVDEELYNMLQSEAKRRRCPSVAALVRKILGQYFAEQEEEAKGQARFEALLEETIAEDEEWGKKILQDFLKELENRKGMATGGKEQ